MSDALERVLQLVAEGKLTAAEAAPILDALEARGGVTSGPAERSSHGAADAAADAPASAVRIEVTDGGRRVVNQRVPLAFGRSVLNGLPGLSEATSERVREAISAGIKGPIVDLDDGQGDGVRVVIE